MRGCKRITLAQHPKRLATRFERGPSASSGGDHGGVMDELEKLQQIAELFEAGRLTEEEFRAAKARLLGLEPGPDGKPHQVVGSTSGEFGESAEALDEPALSHEATSAPPEQDRSVAPGWYQDPAGRYESRYWDGSAWTHHVAEGDRYVRDDGAHPEDSPLGLVGRVGNQGQGEKSGWRTLGTIVAAVVVFLVGSYFFDFYSTDSPSELSGEETDRDQVSDSPPSPPGEEAVLDSAWIDCYSGDMAACDLLILGSQIGSVYEEVGLTCGQRREPSTRTCDPVDLDLSN